MFCKYCGKEISEEALFCSSCGKETGLMNEKKTIQEDNLQEHDIYSNDGKKTKIISITGITLCLLIISGVLIGKKIEVKRSEKVWEDLISQKVWIWNNAISLFEEAKTFEHAQLMDDDGIEMLDACLQYYRWIINSKGSVSYSTTEFIDTKFRVVQEYHREHFYNTTYYLERMPQLKEEWNSLKKQR